MMPSYHVHIDVDDVFREIDDDDLIKELNERNLKETITSRAEARNDLDQAALKLRAIGNIALANRLEIIRNEYFT